MIRTRRLGIFLAVSIVTGAPLAAQTAAQNDSAVKAAATSSSLPLITTR